MSTTTSQIQLKLSLSQELNALLKAKASALGLPVTQFVKHLIVREVEPKYPVFKASKRLEKISKKAMKEYDKAIFVDDIHEYFKNL